MPQKKNRKKALRDTWKITKMINITNKYSELIKQGKVQEVKIVFNTLTIIPEKIEKDILSRGFEIIRRNLPIPK